MIRVLAYFPVWFFIFLYGVVKTWIGGDTPSELNQPKFTLTSEASTKIGTSSNHSLFAQCCLAKGPPLLLESSESKESYGSLPSWVVGEINTHPFSFVKNRSFSFAPAKVQVRFLKTTPLYLKDKRSQHVITDPLLNRTIWSEQTWAGPPLIQFLRRWPVDFHKTWHDKYLFEDTASRLGLCDQPLQLATLALHQHTQQGKQLKKLQHAASASQVVSPHLEQKKPCEAIALLDASGKDPLPTLDDGYMYRVQKLNFNCLNKSLGEDILGHLEDLKVELMATHGGLVAKRDGWSGKDFYFDQIGQTEDRYYASAIIAVAKAIVKGLTAKGYVGIYVSVDGSQIDVNGKDLRPDGDKSLTLNICTSYLDQLHTSSCKNGMQSIDDSKYRRLIRNCPLYAASKEGEERKCKLLNIEEMNDYLYFLNRYPARYVTAEITGIAPDGAVSMDFLVNEDKTWHSYANISNTGTQDNHRWIERFGFVDYQLTHHDDTFSFEYATTDFDGMHGLWGFYEAPIWRMDRLRWRVDAAWSNFNVVVPEILSSKYTGRQWEYGPALIWNFYQYKDLFVDLWAGTYWFGAHVDDGFFNTNVTQTFFLPTFGLVLERNRPITTLRMSVDFETNMSGLAGTSSKYIELLGRVNADTDWWVTYFSFFGSTYYNPCKPDENCQCEPTAHLVNEFTFLLQGQYAYNYRLIPQKEGVLGGLYTVRGYPQSIVAGDTVFFGQFEYRRHLPRKYPSLDCAKFYGTRNWDFLARVFLDAGRAIYNQPRLYEKNDTLVGTGVGVEFFYRRNLMIRADVGVALLDLHSVKYSAGNARGYLSATLMF